MAVILCAARCPDATPHSHSVCGICRYDSGPQVWSRGVVAMEGVKHTKYSGNCRQHILQFLVETDFFVHKNLTFCLASTECTTDRADHTRFTISTFHTSTLGSPRLLILPATGTRGFACSRAFIFRKTRFRKQKLPICTTRRPREKKTKECINFTPLSAKTFSLNSYVFMS